MIQRYIGFNTFQEMLKFEEENNLKNVGRGWNKKNKHFFDVEE